MPKNTFFQFKQFTVWQEKTALKVCTESCILGGYSALKTKDSKTILDIGTGTGLLALMIAQKNNDSKIDAIEIEESAYNQAIENVSKSIFSNQIQVINQDVKNFDPSIQYDFIVSNPPFYQNYLKSETQQRNQALHDTSLTLQDLADVVSRLLSNSGQFIVLLPPLQMAQFEVLANQKGLFVASTLKIYSKQPIISNNSPVFREICVFRKSDSQIDSEFETLYIYEEDKSYSSDFKELLKDYYLHL